MVGSSIEAEMEAVKFIILSWISLNSGEKLAIFTDSKQIVDEYDLALRRSHLAS